MTRPVARAARGPRREAGRMNQTEARYADVLKIRHAAGEVSAWWFEGITLRLGDDCRYTPDFTVLCADGTLECHEVKGFMTDDARVKLKVAAEMYPFRFLLCRWQKGAWQIEEV